MVAVGDSISSQPRIAPIDRGAAGADGPVAGHRLCHSGAELPFFNLRC
jgi:hypothetical protein